MKLRTATLDDLPAIVGLLADDELGKTREQAGGPLAKSYIQAFTDIQAQIGNRVIVACDQAGGIQGCLQLTLTPSLTRLGMKRATIEGVRVSRSQRGRRLGQSLMEHAIKIAKENNCGLVQLTTDRSRQAAQAFYESLGFEPSHIGMKMGL